MMEAFAGFFVIVVFLVLGVMVLVWFRQLPKLFAYLKEKHPDEYAAMGKPTLVMNNTPKNNISFLRFILGNRPSQLGDPNLATKCAFLKKLFYCYMALFIGLVVVVVGVGSASS